MWIFCGNRYRAVAPQPQFDSISIATNSRLDWTIVDRQNMRIACNGVGNAIRPNHCYLGVARHDRFMRVCIQLGWSGTARLLTIPACVRKHGSYRNYEVLDITALSNLEKLGLRTLKLECGFTKFPTPSS